MKYQPAIMTLRFLLLAVQLRIIRGGRTIKNRYAMKIHILLLLIASQVNALEQSAEKVVKDPLDLIPKGYVVFDKIEGDLNKDGLVDKAFIVKGTDKRDVVVDEYRGELDRNRRGLMIFFKQKDGYALTMANLTCFSSENEDGGVYFAPELLVSVEKGILLIHYAHGRYGYWSYKFRYQHGDFELIGYDSSDNHGPLVERMTSINFLSKKVLTKENINQDAQDGGEEVFKETWKRISLQTPFTLKEVEDFDNLDVDKLYKIIQ